MDIRIRRAEKKDIPRILELLLQVDLVHHDGRPDLFRVGTKYSEEQLREMVCDDGKPIFVAVDDNDNVLGYAFCILKQQTADPILTDIRTIYIDDLCVDEAARGRHVGSTLYRYVLQYAGEAGCYNVTLNVWTCNEAAMKFYESCGMKPQKIGMEAIL